MCTVSTLGRFGQGGKQVSAGTVRRLGGALKKSSGKDQIPIS